MKILLTLLLFLPLYLSAQTKAKAYSYTLTGSSIVKDTQGNRVDVASAGQLLNTGKYEIEPVSDGNGNVKEFVIKPKLSSTTAQKAEIESGGYSSAVIPGPKQGQTLPEFSVTDINGKTYKSADLKGKVVVMNFWFSRCVPCKNEIPELNALKEKYKNNTEVVFLAPNWETAETIKQFTATTKFNYNIIPDANDLIAKLQVKAYPVNLVVGKDGRVINSYVGGIAAVDQLLTQDINKALAAKETAQISQ